MMIDVFVLEEFSLEFEIFTPVGVVNSREDALKWTDEPDLRSFTGPFPLYIPPQVQE